MEIVALIVSGLAVLFAGGTMWFAKGEKDAAARSAEEAKRAADAAQEAVAYQRAEVERNRVRFVLEHVNNERYLIRNDGTDTAYLVEVETGDQGVGGQSHSIEDWPSGHAEPYILARSLDSRTTHVELTWHLHPDRASAWYSTRLLVT